MSLLDPILDLFRGKAVTIPPMDGALRPNTALDDAEVVAALQTHAAEVSDLAARGMQAAHEAMMARHH